MQTIHPTRTIVDVFVSRSARTTIALVVGCALLTALAAQIRFHIPGTPVPVTGQTFAVLLSGAVLGARAGATSQILYWVMGAVGLPVFAQASGGWEAATGATMGYLVGFVLAAALIGYLSEREADRRLATSFAVFLLGNLTIYLFGVPWLMHSVGSIDTVGAALRAGFMPFVAFDALKILLAGIALPTAWKLTRGV